jgi:plastocyanin
MKRIASLTAVVILPLALAACTPGTNSNTNTVVLDLVNEATNTAPALNQNVNSSAPTNSNAATGNVNTPTNVNTSVAQSISITSAGFSPSTVTVKAGTVVTWTNSSGRDVRIASDPHPTHTALPELDSSTLATGGTYSFTFTRVGTWGYHDHLGPTLEGVIIVQ